MVINGHTFIALVLIHIVKYQTEYIEQVEPLAKAIEEQRADKAAKCSDAKPAVGEKFWENGTGLVNFT